MGDDYWAVFWGSTAITAAAGVVLGLAAGALSVVVQAVVVAEVAYAAVAEKRTLRALWAQIKPVFWRLIGYAALVSGAFLIVFVALAAGITALGFVLLPLSIALGVVLILAAIPLWLWLSTKLVLVPAVIILEDMTVRGAIARSWRLIRGRFWSALGIIVVVSLTFAVLAQVVTAPFSIIQVAISTILSPTGETDVTAIIAIIVSTVLAQALSVLVQSVALVVQSTAACLIYLDVRMRHEGLDLDLLAYTERRDNGERELADPFRQNVGRVLPRATPATAYGTPVLPPPYIPPAAPTATGSAWTPPGAVSSSVTPPVENGPPHA
nr:glycerophosphoryl diester phosphodiesterase membrane domain-containing protein [Microbacterium endophyticum]